MRLRKARKLRTSASRNRTVEPWVDRMMRLGVSGAGPMVTTQQLQQRLKMAN